MLKKSRRLLIPSLILACCFPTPAAAHHLMINCLREKELLEVEAIYAGGTTAGGAEIKVFSENGGLLAQGISDEQGKFKCEAPLSGSLTIEAVHGGERTVAILSADGKTNFSSSKREGAEDWPIWKIILGVAAISCLSWLAKKILHRLKPTAGDLRKIRKNDSSKRSGG